MSEHLRKFESNAKLQYLLIAGITILAALFRFYRLGTWSFWYDEIYTLRDVRNIFNLGLLDQQFSRLLIYLTVNLLGTSEFTARLAPAVIGILTIPMLYFPTRKIFGPGVALLSALFLAISPWHLYWSQNARFYTALLLFYSLALFAFYFAFEKDRPLYLLFFLVLLGLAVQERLFAVFMAPIAALYLLAVKYLPFEKPTGLRARNIWLLVVPVILIGLVAGYEFISDPGKWLAGFGWVNNNPFWLMGGVVFYIGLVFLCMGSVGGLFLLHQKNRAGLLLAIAAFFPILAILALSPIQYTANRYAFIALTSWLILAAVGVWELLRRVESEAWFLSAGVLLILLLDPVGEAMLYYRYQNGNRDDWKAAFTLINQLKSPDDQVVVTNTLLGDYYTDGKDTVNYRALDLENLPGDGRYWFVEDNNVGDKSPPTQRWLQQNADLIAVFDVHVRARVFKMRVYLYQSDSKPVTGMGAQDP